MKPHFPLILLFSLLVIAGSRCVPSKHSPGAALSPHVVQASPPVASVASSVGQVPSANAGQVEVTPPAEVPTATPEVNRCFVGDLRIRTRADLGALADLTCVVGSVFVSNSDLLDLSGLERLTFITGALSVQSNQHLTQVNGLMGLSSVGGVVHVRYNNVLENVDGLASLRSVGGNLDLAGNPLLKNVDGLRKLTRVQTYVTIESNPRLTHLDGLSGLERVGEALNVERNDALTRLGNFAALSSLGELNIKENKALRNLDGLQALTQVNAGGLWLYFNPALTSVEGLRNLTRIQGSLQIWSCPGLTSLRGLDGVTRFGGLAMNDNPSITTLEPLSSVGQFSDGKAGLISISQMANLTDLDGLRHLRGRVSSLRVSGNSALRSLSGLKGITETTDELWIHDNPILASLSGLDNVTYANGEKIVIERNPALRQCLVESFFKQLKLRGAFLAVHLQDNLPDACRPTYIYNGP